MTERAEGRLLAARERNRSGKTEGRREKKRGAQKGAERSKDSQRTQAEEDTHRESCVRPMVDVGRIKNKIWDPEFPGTQAAKVHTSQVAPGRP